MPGVAGERSRGAGDFPKREDVRAILLEIELMT